MFKLTAPQKSVIETEEFFKNTSISNIGGYAIFDTKVNFEIMKKAINKLIEKADGLRIHLTDKNGITEQYIKEYTPQTVEVLEITENILSVSNDWMQTPFDLSGDLYDFKLLKYQGNDGIFIKLHHVISDAWSMALVLSKVIEYYENILKVEEITDEIPSYTLFVNNEQEYLTSEQYEKDKSYWEKKYEEKPTFVSISDNSGVVSAEGTRKSFVIEKNEKEKIEEYCKKNKISMAVFFEAIVSLYAARINNSDDITLCTLGFNRSGRVERKIVGMFNNILPMTVKIDWNQPFLTLCQSITREHYEIFRHQKYPYDKIMQTIKEKHNVANIYDVMVSFQNARFDDTRETKYKSHWNFNGYAELSFMMNIDDLQNTGGLNINIDYKNEAFTEEEIEKIYNRLIYIISQIVKPNNTKEIEQTEQSKELNSILFKDIEIVTPKERKQILQEFNATKKEYPKEKRLYDYLEEQVKTTPNKIALKFEEKTITYKEFNEKVNSVTNYLLTNKIKQGSIIAVMMERSFDMMIAIYAILKSGCAYMPIDPQFPRDRIDFMLEDSEAPFILTHKKWNDKIQQKEIKIINLDDFEYSNYSTENPTVPVSSQDVAYVIYTSGSTGKPKGAQIQHHSVSNRIKWMHEKYPLQSEDVILQKTPYTFDVSVWELFWWSMYGGSLQILIPEGHKDPREIIEAVEKGKVTHMHFVPSMLNAFLEYLENNQNLIPNLKTLKYVFASGEALQSEHVKKFYALLGTNKTTLHNLYGPTECTVDVSYYDCPSEKIPSSIPIGKPVDNTQLLILDKACKLLPIGASGELHISGVLVGKGYIKREELTKEKFIKNEYYEFKTMYKTGDLAKWLPDGNIEYLGRIDHQVKIRGLRVELGDIETAILKYPSMINCVVTVFEHLGEKYLCGYYTAKEKINIALLKNELIKELPDYMVPSYYVQLAEMPLNHNGKIDRKKLPMPDLDVQEEYVAPSNEIEQKIQECVQKVIKREKVSVESDLLTSGLTSLGVITLITKLSTLNIDIKVRDFYENRTIRQLTNVVQSKTEKDIDYIEDEKYKNISDIKDIIVPEKEDGNILLTGATGFLGIHLLDELYHKTNKKIYCLIRKMNKFEDFIKSYTTIPANEIASIIALNKDETTLNNKNSSFNNARVIPLLGDITDKTLGLTPEKYNEIKTDISTIIHSAANVSFFCSWEKANGINYQGTCNVIKLAEESNAKLHHISTMSVSGDILTGQTTMYPQFTEDTLYIGQLYKENVYAYSKYLAEKEIVKAIREKRINASIYRVPNLTWRIKDGAFQKNFKENDLYMMTRVMERLQKVPIEIKDENILLAPVDDLVAAIAKLLNKKGNNVYHLVSTSSPTIEKYMKYITEIKCEPLEKLYEQLTAKPEDEEMQFVSMYLAGILKDAEKLVVHVHSEKTAKILEELGFNWTRIDENYVKYVKDIK